MYVVTVHLCGGSQAEASQHQYVVGPFATRSEATKADRDLYNAGSQISSYLRDEMICDVIEIPEQAQTVANVVEQLRRNHGD